MPSACTPASRRPRSGGRRGGSWTNQTIRRWWSPLQPQLQLHVQMAPQRILWPARRCSRQSKLKSKHLSKRANASSLEGRVDVRMRDAPSAMSSRLLRRRLIRCRHARAFCVVGGIRARRRALRCSESRVPVAVPTPRGVYSVGNAYCTGVPCRHVYILYIHSHCCAVSGVRIK